MDLSGVNTSAEEVKTKTRNIWKLIQKKIIRQRISSGQLFQYLFIHPLSPKIQQHSRMKNVQKITTFETCLKWKLLSGKLRKKCISIAKNKSSKKISVCVPYEVAKVNRNKMF